MKKRALSLLLALVMTLTLAAPVLARDDTETIFSNINSEVDEVGSPALRIITLKDATTWSYNDASDGCGMFELIGARLDNYSGAESTNGGEITNNFDNGYTCSSWALDEVRQADWIGIFPDSLRHVDLRENIMRAEFAAVSVNTYVLLARQTVQPYSPNPFSNTNDADVLRAYAAQLTDGMGGGKFSPNTLLTREQGATMLARAYKHALYPDYTLARDDEFQLEYSRPAFFDDDESISDTPPEMPAGNGGQKI